MAEIHVDDLFLRRGGRWADAATLVDSIASTAENACARLCFRFRENFAGQAARQGRDNLLQRLQRRGHELGTHAHGRHLARAMGAGDACGVDNRGVSPGMVQAGRRAGALFDQLAALGFAWMTDVPPERIWSTAGWLPWLPAAGYRADGAPLGPVAIETSADPFAWGLLERHGDQIRHRYGLDAACFDRLEALMAIHARRQLPAGQSGYFGFTLHEHNLCAAGTLRPEPASLQALGEFLRGKDVRTAGELAAELAEEASPQPRRRVLAPRLARALRLGLAAKAPAARLRRSARLRLDGLRSAPADSFSVRREDQRLHARWIGPRRPRGLLLLCHAGQRGGCEWLLQPFGMDPRQLTGAGIAVVAYDRAGTGRSRARVALTPGNPVHVRDFQAVFDAVRRKLTSGAPLGVLSFSSGILPPLRAGRPLAFLADGEAPADRYSLLPPAGSGAPCDPRLQACALHDEASWQGREPLSLVGALTCPYHRLQAALDHVHGRMRAHAQLMLEEARQGASPRVRCNGARALQPLPGRLHSHGPAIARWILEEFEAATGAG